MEKRELKKQIMFIVCSGLLLMIITFVVGKNTATEAYKYIAYTGGYEVMLYPTPDESIELETLRNANREVKGERIYVLDPDVYSPTGYRFAKCEANGKEGYIPFCMLKDRPNVPAVSDSLGIDPNDMGYSYYSESGYHWSYVDYPEIAKAYKKSQQ